MAIVCSGVVENAIPAARLEGLLLEKNRERGIRERNPSRRLATPVRDYSVFGIGVDRRNAAKCLFHQEKGTLKSAQKVYIYSENALKRKGREASRPDSS
jgi:hypothetical protein